MSHPEKSTTPEQNRRLSNFIRSRRPLFWWSIALGILGFIALLTDPLNRTWQERVGNAFGAALMMGLFPPLVAWIARSVKSWYLSLKDKEPAPDRVETASSYRPDTTYPPHPGGEQWLAHAASECLSVHDLHPWIRDAVKTRWGHGLYSDAVAEAAKSLNSAVQDKLRRRDVSDDSLLQAAFSDDLPKSGSPRLRFHGDQGTPSMRSRMRGARGLSQACFAGIRNIVAHERDVTWSPKIALFYLALLSVLAEWIDECEVYRMD